MLLDSPALPLPALTPKTLHSFYPYPVIPRTNLHQSLRGESRPFPPTSNRGDPGPSTTRQKAKNAQERAARRALMGRRPAGVALGREAEELSEEEDALEDEKQGINLFGHRFLLPYGRRLTQMEMDAAPSPTPSEADQERRQEDLNARSPTSPVIGEQVAGGEGEEDGAEGERDLDASMEDMDQSGGEGDEVGDDEEAEEGAVADGEEEEEEEDMEEE